MSVLEKPGTAGVLADARAGFDGAMPTPGDAAAGTLALIARYGQLAGAVVLVAVTVSPLAGVVITVTALVVRRGQRGSLGKFGLLWLSLQPLRQRMMYLRTLGAGPKAAKEMRMLGILDWYRERHRSDSRALLDPLWKGRRGIYFRPFLGHAAVALAGGAIVLTLLATTAADGRMSLAQIAIAVQAVLIPVRFGVHFPEADVQTQYGMLAYDALTGFEQAAADGQATQSGERTTPTAPREGIRFDGVEFGYGGAPVLDGVTFTLPAGRSTAIVGLNGAGKTTLVKLLARLYDPDAGAILADGVDLRRHDPREWQRQLAIIFQDYVRYELDAAANISGLAEPEGTTPETLMAAARRAGAEEIVTGLPHGLGTILSRQYRGGTDLSGGQWQRLALARAFHAVQRGASVLVLDEPTAHLDVRAEVAFYDNFLALTEGLTTLIISHRFSTVRRADQIVVLDGGRVAEVGGHDELTAANGLYAELFRMQASRFEESVTL
jgi:ATP-binding cassette subfamily B protein